MKFKTFPDFVVKKNAIYVAVTDKDGIFEIDESNVNFVWATLMFPMVEEIEPEIVQEIAEVPKPVEEIKPIVSKGGVKNVTNRKRSNSNSPKTTRPRGKSGQH